VGLKTYLLASHWRVLRTSVDLSERTFQAALFLSKHLHFTLVERYILINSTDHILTRAEAC